MTNHNLKSGPTCSRCGSDKITLRSRTHVGDTRTDDVIRTEMLGCAVIFKYMACEDCGKSLTRAEYESFQKGGICS